MSELLIGENLTKTYGGLVALDDVSVRIGEGEICCLVGPNGAGKTTLLNVLTGRETKDSGSVRFGDVAIDDMTPDEICRRGLVKTNQIVRPFGDLSVLENVAIAAAWGDETVSTMRDAKDRARELIDFVGLSEFTDAPAGRLTHTPNRRLEVARALATSPEVILMDEAAAGLNSEELNEFLEMVESIRDDLDVTILWIEHVMEAVMSIAERIIVLEYGEVIAEGTPDEIVSNERVQEAYLGGKSHA